MKKILALMLALTLVLGLAACAGNNDQSETNQTETNQTEDTAAPETGDETAADAETDAETEGDTAAAMSGPITVISREEGSGTRGAFVELMGVETDEGDMTTVDAEIANSTSLVQSTVAGNSNAIGYISLGSYDASAVKAVKVDGVEVSVDTIKAGDYAVSRPFVVCYKEENLTSLPMTPLKATPPPVSPAT